MYKCIAILIAGLITNFYYFPAMFKAFPVANTKMMIAALGLVILGLQLAKGKSGKMDKAFLNLSVFAIIFSLICLLAVIYNGTNDYTYATYIMSMWVWFGGAYAVCQIIKSVHGEISLETLSHYIIAVCLANCILALLIDQNATVRTFIESHFYVEATAKLAKRLYSIGIAALDTAGVRFSVALILLANLMVSNMGKHRKLLFPVYVLAFAALTIIGNMMARTTLVGVGLGLAFIAYRQISGGERKPFSSNEILVCLLLILFVVIPVTVYFSNTNESINKYLRFGFEGFFSLVEQGHWQVGSNEQLRSMVVFPDNIKTWIIGDGYMINPITTDPYFVGKITGGYYMGTDVGYCRFIFYCGLTGLLAFSAFFCRAGIECYRHFNGKGLLITLLVMTNFIIWMKVATDIFFIFAMLLMVDLPKENRNESVRNITVE